MPLDTNTLRELIASGETAKVFPILLGHFQSNPNPGQRNTVIALQSRWSDYQRDFSNGVTTDRSELAKIRVGLLNLLDEIENAPVPGPPVVPRNGPPKFVVIYDIADSEECKLLNKHLAVLKMTKKILVYNVNESQFDAAGVMAEARAQLADASYILALVTVNLFNSPDWFGLLEEERLAGRRIIPIRLGKVGGYEDTDLVKLRSLPTNNRTVKDFPNTDAAYEDIVSEIRKLR